MKGKHIRNRVGRKLTARLYQSRLIVFEWTSEMEAMRKFGEALGVLADALRQECTRKAIELGLFPSRQVSRCAQCGQAPCGCPCGTTEDG